MVKIISIVGARPQFVKLAPLCREIKKNPQIQHLIVHTGQHFDKNMSDDFFKELDIPQPNYNLNIGSGTHAHQTGYALEKIEKILEEERPDKLVVFGDTNATLSGALAGAKVGVPVCHIEAGLRSYNKKMPEEINRIAVDKISDVLFCSEDGSISNLENEACSGAKHNVGDIMVDQVNHVRHKKKNNKELYNRKYVFMTMHRQESTKSVEKIISFLDEVNNLGKELEVIFPVHPRMESVLKNIPPRYLSNIKTLEPLGYVDTIHHVQNAQFVITDSGGLQKEAYLLKTPCITARTETEWVDTVEKGWNVVVGLDPRKLSKAVQKMLEFDIEIDHPALYGDGMASQKIVTELLKS